MRKQQFSLIELMLALGVVIIGVCSVMVLFPIGANASRDASMETFAAQAADQLLNFTKYQLSLPETATINWRTRIGLEEGSSPLLPDSKPSESNGGLDCLAAAWSRSTNMSALGLNLFYYSTEADGLFQLVSYRGNPANNFSITDTDIDYRVMMRMWTSQIDLDGDGNSDLNQQFAVRLNVEASWPAEIPYAQRQTALYTLDVFRPPKTANYAN